MKMEEICRAIAKDIRKIIDAVAESPIGVNPKSRKNTLAGSKTIKNSKINVSHKNGEVLINILFDNYMYYIEHGRRPRTGKQPPIDALRDWAMEHNLSPDNSTLFLIARAIWRDGFVGRPILATIEEEMNKRMEEQWGDMILDNVAEEMEKIMTEMNQ